MSWDVRVGVVVDAADPRALPPATRAAISAVRDDHMGRVRLRYGRRVRIMRPGAYILVTKLSLSRASSTNRVKVSAAHRTLSWVNALQIA